MTCKVYLGTFGLTNPNGIICTKRLFPTDDTIAIKMTPIDRNTLNRELNYFEQFYKNTLRRKMLSVFRYFEEQKQIHFMVRSPCSFTVTSVTRQLDYIWPFTKTKICQIGF